MESKETAQARTAPPRLRYFYNGRFLTLEEQSPEAPHLLAAGDTILHCGIGAAPLGLDFRSAGFDAVRHSLSGDVDFVDLGGATVIPGLVDAHVHFVWWCPRPDAGRPRPVAQ